MSQGKNKYLSDNSLRQHYHPAVGLLSHYQNHNAVENTHDPSWKHILHQKCNS